MLVNAALCAFDELENMLYNVRVRLLLYSMYSHRHRAAEQYSAPCRSTVELAAVQWLMCCCTVQ